MPGFADLHPYQPEDTLQGMLQLLFELQEYLAGNLRACRRARCNRPPGRTAS